MGTGSSFPARATGELQGVSGDGGARERCRPGLRASVVSELCNRSEVLDYEYQHSQVLAAFWEMARLSGRGSGI